MLPPVVETFTPSSNNRYDQIVLLGVDFFNNDKDTFFWNCVPVLNTLCKKVSVVVNRGISKHRVFTSFDAFSRVGSCIPRSFFGHFRDLFYIIRTVYTALWIIFNFNTNVSKRTLIVMDCSSVAIPMFRYYGFDVISLEFYRQFLTEYQLQETASIFDRMLTPIREKMLNQANMILLPCKNALELVPFLQETRVCIAYPPAEGEHVKRYMDENGVIFEPIYYQRLCLSHILFPLYPPHPLSFDLRGRYQFVAMGIYEPESNFDVVVDAFYVAVDDLNFIQQCRFHLEILGTGRTSAHVNYRESLKQYVDEKMRHLKDLISFHTNLNFDEQCAYLRTSFAVLNANTSFRIVPSIIEANYFGRLVITIESKFINEVVTDDETGYIYVGDYYQLGAAMYNIVMQRNACYAIMSLAAWEKYRRFYSLNQFRSCLKQCILYTFENNM